MNQALSTARWVGGTAIRAVAVAVVAVVVVGGTMWVGALAIIYAVMWAFTL